MSNLFGWQLKTAFEPRYTVWFLGSFTKIGVMTGTSVTNNGGYTCSVNNCSWIDFSHCKSDYFSMTVTKIKKNESTDNTELSWLFIEHRFYPMWLIALSNGRSS